MITTNCVTVAFLYKALEDGDAKLALQLFKGLGVRMPIFRGGGRMPTGSIGTAADAIGGKWVRRVERRHPHPRYSDPPRGAGTWLPRP